MTELDGEQLANEYAGSRQRMRSLLQGATDEQAATIVPTCPDWSVKDLVSHVTGICVDLSSGNPPTDDVQGWVDRQVAERTEHAMTTVLDEWDAASLGFEAMVREHPQRFGTLLIDLVTHEHDAASALGVSSDREHPSIGLVLDLKQKMVENDLATHNLGTIRLTSPTGTWTYGQGEPELEVRGSTWELFRASGGRRSMAQLKTSDHTGDIAKYAPGLSHNDLPVSDIQE